MSKDKIDYALLVKPDNPGQPLRVVSWGSVPLGSDLDATMIKRAREIALDNGYSSVLLTKDGEKLWESEDDAQPSTVDNKEIK